ncbi:hypothetical protein [Nonomuraea solani]|nr:hypothetical protein [Nonomuraea solani]
MTSEQDSPPSDERFGEGHEPDESVYRTPPPRTVTIAATLWISLGALLVAGMVYYALDPRSAPLSTGLLTLVVWIGVGVAFIVLGKLMRQGSTRARTALTVMGIVSLAGLWTALLVVPAIVLQFRPASSAWFKAINTGKP